MRFQTDSEVLNDGLMSCCWSWSHVHLSTHEFVALPIDRELAEFFESDLRNDFDAHERIIHLDPLTDCPFPFLLIEGDGNDYFRDSYFCG